MNETDQVWKNGFDAGYGLALEEMYAEIYGILMEELKEDVRTSQEETFDVSKKE